MTTENTFKKGDIVYDKVRPYQKLIIEKVIGKIYYCQDAENTRKTSQVYFAHDLKGING